MDDIIDKAKELNSIKGSNSQNRIDLKHEIEDNIDIINDIYEDFHQGTAFYTNLLNYISSLQKVVNDFYFARDLDKQTRLKELENPGLYSSFQNSGKFFTEETGQFPQGKSYFLPPGHQNKPQNNLKNQTKR